MVATLVVPVVVMVVVIVEIIVMFFLECKLIVHWKLQWSWWW